MNPLYDIAAKAHLAHRKAEAAYQWASTDFHEHARVRQYRSDWVPAAAYEVAKKAKVAYELGLTAKRKANAFEKAMKVPFCPPQRQAANQQASTNQ